MPAKELRSLAYKIAANKLSILRAVDRAVPARCYKCGGAALLTSPAERPIHHLRWQVLHPRARARVGRKRPRRFEIFDDRAQVNRFGIKRFVLRDLGPIQNLESVALEHLFAAPAFKGDDLAINALLAAAIKITKIRAHERA